MESQFVSGLLAGRRAALKALAGAGALLAGSALEGGPSAHAGASGVAAAPGGARAARKAPPPLDYADVLPDEWPVNHARLDTWATFATDVPPETAGYAWRRNEAAAKVRPPTGLGARVAAAVRPADAAR